MKWGNKRQGAGASLPQGYAWPGKGNGAQSARFGSWCVCRVAGGPRTGLVRLTPVHTQQRNQGAGGQHGDTGLCRGYDHPSSCKAPVRSRDRAGEQI